MKNMKNTLRISVLLAIVAVIGILALPATSATAATATKTITITQDQINSSYKVTNPRNRAITDVKVTVENGQVSIAATITPKGKDPIQTVSVWKPNLYHGLVYWKLESVTANGKTGTQQDKVLATLLHRDELRTITWKLLREALERKAYHIDKITLTPGTITLDVTVYGLPKPKTSATMAATAAR